MLSYRALPPHPLLSEFINSYVVFEGNFPEGAVWDHDLIPALMEFVFFNLSEDPQLFTFNEEEFYLRDTLVTGQFSIPFQAHLSKHIKIIGVSMKIPSLTKLLHFPMHYVSNSTIRLYDVIGIAAYELHQRVVEQKTIEESIQIIEGFLFQKLNALHITKTFHDYGQALHIIHQQKGNTSVGQLIKETGISERKLERIFLQHGGLSPKLYARVHRFNEVIWHFNHNRTVSPDFIYELGYYDQSHFINEFKKLSGFSPSTYFKNHVGVNEFFTSQ